MNEKYYLAVFNEETWNEFLEKGSSVYGTTSTRQKRMESTKPGDFLICYVTRLSRFVGLLEITSKAYLENRHIWKNDIYPIRVNVRPLYILKAENGILFSELKEECGAFEKYKNTQSWAGFVRTSLNTIQDNDAKIIVDKLKVTSNQ